MRRPDSSVPMTSASSSGARRFWRMSLRTSRTGLVLLSLGIVGSMIASVAMGPIGNKVLAQDGYGKRDREGGGILTTLVESILPEAAPAARAPRRERFARWQTAAFTPRRGASIRMAWTAPSLSRWRHQAPTGVTPVAVADAAHAPLAHHAVCVRLCDGYFFPMGQLHDRSEADTQATLCAGLCPGAPTRLFVTRGGADEIDRATALTNGQGYGELPMAYAHTREVGPTCACHPMGDETATAVSPLTDTTLRSGDSIMTPVGWRVFQGADHWPYRRSDFATVRAAANLPAKTRTTLVRMEYASLAHPFVASGFRPLVVTPRVHVAASLGPDGMAGTASSPRTGGGSVGTP